MGARVRTPNVVVGDYDCPPLAGHVLERVSLALGRWKKIRRWRAENDIRGTRAHTLWVKLERRAGSPCVYSTAPTI
jgi:hypothetical protein